MSKAQNFSTRTGKTILEEAEDEQSRSLPPLLRRNSTEVVTALTKDDQALLDDMLEADSEKEKVPQTTTKTVREEFENVQQGLLAVFYQNEHHTKIIMEKLADAISTLETSVKKIDEVLQFLK